MCPVILFADEHKTELINASTARKEYKRLFGRTSQEMRVICVNGHEHRRQCAIAPISPCDTVFAHQSMALATCFAVIPRPSALARAFGIRRHDLAVSMHATVKSVAWVDVALSVSKHVPSLAGLHSTALPCPVFNCVRRAAFYNNTVHVHIR